jgi:hypothetical protein
MPCREDFIMRLAAAGLCLMLVGPDCSAGPPGGPAGEMVFDTVADGLRRYRQEKDPEKRIRGLEKLAATRDPRVAVALHELANDLSETERVRIEATFLLARKFIYGSRFDWGGEVHTGEWWKANEAELRRRAKQLP